MLMKKAHIILVLVGTFASGNLLASKIDTIYFQNGDRVTAEVKELAAALDDLKSACDAEGRDYADIETTCMWPGKGGREFIGALEDVGVSRVVTPLFAFGANPMEGIQKIAEEVIAG